jgi:hypothetical protein
MQDIFLSSKATTLDLGAKDPPIYYLTPSRGKGRGVKLTALVWKMRMSCAISPLHICLLRMGTTLLLLRRISGSKGLKYCAKFAWRQFGDTQSGAEIPGGFCKEV